jgi:hypothetical protein
MYRSSTWSLSLVGLDILFVFERNEIQQQHLNRFLDSNKLSWGFFSLKRLSHEIDFKNFDKK